MVKKPFVFSGGGARGFAHLGVTKSLAEHGIIPAAISGTSAGAIAGAFLANGFTPDEVIELLVGKLQRRMIGWNSFRTGWMSFSGIAEFLERNLRYKSFEELPIPLYITATSFVDGSQKVFHSGQLMDAIIASCAIPAIFPAYTFEGIPYVDGALSNNLPVEPFLNHKQDIIAVHVNPLWDLEANRGLRSIIERSFHLSFAGLTKRSAEGCLMFIEPPGLTKFNLFDLGKAGEIVETGYIYTNEYLKTHMPLTKAERFMDRLRMRFKGPVKP